MTPTAADSTSVHPGLTIATAIGGAAARLYQNGLWFPGLRQLAKVIALLALSSLLLGAGWRPSEANDVKARVVLRLIKFVDWPADSFAAESSPLRVCVDSHPRLRRALDAVNTGSWRGRSIVVSNSDPVCHVKVVGPRAKGHGRASEQDATPNAEAALARATSPPTLLISDRRHFLREGGHVRLSLAIDTVRFDVNATQARQDDLRISSELLSIARKVI